MSKVPKFACARPDPSIVTATNLTRTRLKRCAIALLCALGTCVCGLGSLRAAEAYSADAVKAEFLYRFASYIEWPGNVPSDTPFTIGVAGVGGVFTELQRLAPGRTIQNRPAAIRKVSAATDLAHLQILYLPSHSQHGGRALLAAAAGRPILVVSDEEGGLSAGSIVNFLESDRHVRFEISLTAAESSKLKINSGLLSAAARVQGARPRADASCWRTSTFGMTPACLLRSVAAATGPVSRGRDRLRLASAPP